MNETNTSFLIAVVTGISLVISALVSGAFGLNRAKANALTSAEWKRLYDEMEKRMSAAEGRVTELEQEQSILKEENKLLKILLDELWDGIVILSGQLTSANIEPGYKPGNKPVFRGNDDEPPWPIVSEE